MDGITLQNFTSILEILTVYYIGTATSDSFKHLFGINETFGESLKKNELFGVLRELPIDDLRIDGSSVSNAELKKKEKHAQRIHKIYRAYLSIDNIVERKYNFLDSPNLFKCIRPFYIYFGALSLGLLLLAGILEKWHRSYSLVLLNSLTILVSLLLVYKLWRIGDTYKHWGTIKSFILSLILIFALIFLPENFVLHNLKWRIPDYAIQNKLFEISYIDFHIIFIICLLFIPLTIHMLCLVRLMFQVYSLKRRLIKYGILSSEVKEQQQSIKKGRTDFFSDIPILKQKNPEK